MCMYKYTENTMCHQHGDDAPMLLLSTSIYFPISIHTIVIVIVCFDLINFLIWLQILFTNCTEKNKKNIVIIINNISEFDLFYLSILN